MGYGNYSHEAHEALSRAREGAPQQQVFKQQSCHPLMNPRGAGVRESRDTPEHPNSIPVTFALDVTGSMAEIPTVLARTELPQFMKLLTDWGIVGAQLMFMAVGDATSDRAPLQVGQFETTAELMDQWLTWSFLERGGGGSGQESYEIALYYLAEHTDTDAWAKRKKRGYLFMTGDELPYPAVSRHQVDAVIGDKLDEDITTEAVVAAVQETYEPFFLIPDRERAKRCERRWRDLLGDHVVVMDNPTDTCRVAASLLALNEGVLSDVDQLAKHLAGTGVERARANAIVHAVTPFALTIGKDAAPGPAAHHGASGGLASLWKRLTKAARP